MFEFIREQQLNLMLLLCGGCIILAFLLSQTHFLEKRRKRILIFMELTAFLLLWFDRMAYIYAADVSHKGFIMVRVSNFFVFFLTSTIVFGYNLYLIDLLNINLGLKKMPVRIKLVSILSALGMLLAVISAKTDLYYYFDEANQYHRGQGFIIAYIIPVLCPIIQYTVIRQYREKFSKLIYISLVLYIFVPIVCGIVQIFAYGISIVNMAMVVVSISLYVFTYLDLNNTVEHAHAIEIANMQGEQDRMQRLFTQTAMSFVSAVEKKDEFSKGNSLKVAEFAKKIALGSGMSEEESKKVYYAALLHDVGLIGIPDDVIKNDTDPDNRNLDVLRLKPMIGEEILSNITEYPYLSQGAHYSHERYNGTGYPEGLKGEEIPRIARIIAVADAYVSLSSKKRYRDAHPGFIVREAFVKGAGEDFDPVYADIMVKIIDSEGLGGSFDRSSKLETEIFCKDYRDNISNGIVIEEDEKKISFDYEPSETGANIFSAPSIVLFDSYDRRTHNNEKTIESYHYIEYGEIWFDKYCISTAARKIEEKKIEDTISSDDNHYEIIAGRYEDHVRLVMRSKDYAKEVIIALPSGSKAAYIGLTGEHCTLSNISTEPTGEKIGPDSITRIVSPVSYIEHLEADLKNIQIDRPRSASTEGVEISDKITLAFHTMSLPEADLIWHCPYIVLFSSDDGLVGGENYHEYQVIKLSGEDDGDKEFSKNKFTAHKSPEFPGWEKWKESHKEGMNCEIFVERKGDRIILKTENLGLAIENTTTILEKGTKAYIALTGDQVALTDIRILKK